MRHSVLLLFFLCSACAFNEEYPDNWSPVIVGTTECPDISGIYKNGGNWASEIEQSNKSDIFLSSYFQNNISSTKRRLLLRIPISIVFKRLFTVLASRIHLSRSLAPMVTFLVRTEGSGFRSLDFRTMDLGQWKAFWEWATARYGSDSQNIEDGSLVGEALYSEVGVVFIMIPVASSSKDYILWNAVGSNSNS